MSFAEIFQRGMVGLALAVFSLISLTSCEDKDIYAETIADLTWGDEDETLFYYTVNFIAEEGEGVDGGEFGGKPFKNRSIEAHTVEYRKDVEQRKGYKPGVKPLKHQKIKIEYEKTYPYNFGFLEHFKYQDEQGNIVELK